MNKKAMVLVMMLLNACVKGWLGSGVESGQPLKQGFMVAASSNRVPVQLLLAVAWLESRMTADAAAVVYDEELTVGEENAETAFGVPRHRLARFVNEDEDLAQLGVQAATYARLLRAHLDDNAIELPAVPENAAQLLVWVQALAQLQRTGDEQRSNERTLFALELLEVLNRGFEWRDALTGEEIILPSHTPRLERMLIPYPQQQFFNLRTTAAQLYQTHWLQPTQPHTQGEKNHPREILVTHCPFSLSACLQLQNAARTDGSVELQAHYIIPADPTVIDYPLQVVHHDQQVAITAADGQVELHNDKIVIMLSGSSGRIVDNLRQAADPTWQSSFQLEWLGYMVKELCAAHLGLRSQTQIRDCSNPQHANTRVKFRIWQTDSEVKHRWGEIADFDRSIYTAYLQQPRRLQTEFVWLDQRTDGKFGRGHDIRLALPSNGRNWYVLEKLVRCSQDGRLLYVPLQQGESTAAGQQQFRVAFYDSGPNGDGTQFLRAKVFKRDKLQAWAVTRLRISDYDADTDSIHYEGCKAALLRNADRL